MAQPVPDVFGFVRNALSCRGRTVRINVRQAFGCLSFRRWRHLNCKIRLNPVPAIFTPLGTAFGAPPSDLPDFMPVSHRFRPNRSLFESKSAGLNQLEN
jgi:hypothetical protein